MPQIIEVVFVGVCFTFETDGTVGTKATLIFNKVEEIFDEVPKVETDPEQFPLLTRVDAFVVEQRRIDPTLMQRTFRLIANKDDAKEVDGIVASKRDISVENDHFRIYN